jgi:hypothetical protein
MNKSRRKEWVGHVARMGESRGVYRIWWGILRDRDYFEDPGIHEKIILRWIFRKWEMRAWTGLSWLRIGTGDGHL